MREYDQIFDWYVAERNPEVGVTDVEEFICTLPPGARILELGCGSGIPITRLLVRSGFAVFGVDSSARMIAGFRANFPGLSAQCATIQDSDFFSTDFAAVIAWGVLFHLTPDEQGAALAKIARHLQPHGRLLFTAGDKQGTRDGKMNEVDFRYYSLNSDEYERILSENGMRLLDRHNDRWENVYYIAEKEGQP
ncbi:MAG: class I SAM-dependent methyltransferase [Terriglobales bacterium]